MASSMLATDATPDTVVLEMSEHLGALAAAGEWDELEQLVVRLQRAILDVPEHRRRDLARMLKERLAGITDEARRARGEVSRELTHLRRGQKATQAYGLR